MTEANKKNMPAAEEEKKEPAVVDDYVGAAQAETDVLKENLLKMIAQMTG